MNDQVSAMPRHVLGVTMADLVTVAGGLCGAFGLHVLTRGEMSGFVVLSLLSLFLDCIDGFVARSFNCVTEKGAMLDWGVDTGLAHATAWTVWPGHASWISAALIAWQAVALDFFRISGRSLVTLLAIAQCALM